MARKFAAVVFSLGCAHASSVWSLGLGELSLESFLNEPLQATVDLLNTGGLHGDEIKIRLATKEDFDNIGLERAYFLTSIKFEVEMGEDGQPRILISSEDPVLEPYLDFIVEARWPSGRLLREYTVLVDPPVFDSTTPVVSASQRVEEVEGIPAPGKKNEQTSAGTSVSVRSANSASGTMPARDFNAQTSASPSPGSRYMIQRDDTLWQVAEQARPAGVSVHQTMLDIQRLNPNAFINGNINQIKAGYIIYLPDSGDISSADLEAALAEVRQQNEDWRENRVAQPVYESGPSLRISADPDQDVTDAPGAAGDRAAGASLAALEDLEKSELERAELEQRVASMQQQVETLQRIVDLKDEQIASLQAELGQAAVDTGAAETAEGDSVATAEAGESGLDATTQGEDTAGKAAAAPAAAAPAAAASAAAASAAAKSAKPAPKVQPKPQQAPDKAAAKPAQDGGGLMTTVLYGAGATLLAIMAFMFVRRRRGETEQELELTTDVETRTDAAEHQIAEPVSSGEASPQAELADQEVEEGPATLAEAEADSDADNRGYGEHKHDEYVSDVDDVDALAEADIYIAYGRYPQAIELLQNAIGSEPGNPAYRLKLLELHADMGDRDAALQQFTELQAINEPTSLARAETLLASIGAAAPPAVEDAELEISPLELIEDTDKNLEASFSGLEIEDLPADEGVDEELDLSADFSDDELDSDALEEDLVVAAESNGLSTKLDLARAYMDMGDDDGARQILEEVASEGTDDLKSEALELLDRIA